MDKEITEALSTTPRAPKAVISNKDIVSSGSTLLNLLCSSRPNGCFAKGKYYFMVGDSSSGKTWLALTVFAEATQSKHFANYDLIHDNVEDGALMDLGFYFGAEVNKRIRPPAYAEDKSPIFSSTVESFYYHMDDAIARAEKTGRPFIYVLDSQDSLDSSAASDKFQEQKKAFEEGKDSAGSYGDGKAKIHSENIRRVLLGLRKTNSILIVIGQTRDNLGMGFEKKTRSGGKSLRFYATVEIWTSIKEKLKKNVRGRDRVIGQLVEVQTKKNRITGTLGTVTIPIYLRYGIDDIGSCIDYLIAEKHWTGTKTNVEAPEFKFDGTREKLIQHIETNGLERDLRQIAADVWNDVEQALAPRRKPRYA